MRAAPIGGTSKRAFDLTLSLAALVILFPILLALAAVIRLSSPGSPVFGHERVGRGGRAFRCYKLRTMVRDGDAVLERHLAAHPAAMAEWQETRKLRHDPRVTAIGRILRKTSLDELPQLINVLRGDMSLVGPRPVVRQELERYGPAARAYLATRPGLTGLWQVSGRSDTTYESRVAFDLLYVETWSFLRDIVIVTKTVPVILRTRGSY